MVSEQELYFWFFFGFKKKITRTCSSVNSTSFFSSQIETHNVFSLIWIHPFTFEAYWKPWSQLWFALYSDKRYMPQLRQCCAFVSISAYVYSRETRLGTWPMIQRRLIWMIQLMPLGMKKIPWLWPDLLIPWMKTLPLTICAIQLPRNFGIISTRYILTLAINPKCMNCNYNLEKFNKGETTSPNTSIFWKGYSRI